MLPSGGKAPRWVCKTSGGPSTTVCEGVVLTSPALGRDSGFSVSEIHLISLEWSREPVVPRPASCTLGIWGLRTAELHGSQFRSPVFFRGSAIPAPSTSAPPPPAPLMFWPQSCPRPVDLSGLCLDSFAPSAPTQPAWEPLD